VTKPGYVDGDPVLETELVTDWSREADLDDDELVERPPASSN
jgi:hypothetical protein